MFCHKCGKELKTNDKFCEKCGAVIGSPNEEQLDHVNTSETTKKAVNWKTIILLVVIAIPLGLFLRAGTNQDLVALGEILLLIGLLSFVFGVANGIKSIFTKSVSVSKQDFSTMGGKNKLIFAVFIILLVITGGYFYSNGKNPLNNSMKIPFPYVTSVSSNTSFACEALLSSSIIGSPRDYLTDGIEGSVDKGTDKIAMSIKDEKTLTLQTGANVSAGVTTGDDFSIIQNDKNKLLAAWSEGNAISTVVINKNNGLAIWSKQNPDFITYDAPYGSIIYMICR